MVTKTDELVQRFEEWASDLAFTLRPRPDASDSELRSSLARRETIAWCRENLKRIRDEIDKEG